MKNINVYANSYVLCFLETKWVKCNQSRKKYEAPFSSLTNEDGSRPFRTLQILVDNFPVSSAQNKSDRHYMVRYNIVYLHIMVEYYLVEPLILNNLRPVWIRKMFGV